MRHIGIFYGSATGTTAEVAHRIADALGVEDKDVRDVAPAEPTDVAPYDALVLGSLTWNNGELEEDWYDFIDGLQALDLSGKKVALFGCGDETMTDTFCNAVGTLYERLQPTHAVFIGEFPADGYKSDRSSASDGATMRGLVLDEVNHPEYTSRRIKDWVVKLKTEM